MPVSSLQTGSTLALVQGAGVQTSKVSSLPGGHIRCVGRARVNLADGGHEVAGSSAPSVSRRRREECGRVDSRALERRSPTIAKPCRTPAGPGTPRRPPLALCRSTCQKLRAPLPGSLLTPQGGRGSTAVVQFNRKTSRRAYCDEIQRPANAGRGVTVRPTTSTHADKPVLRCGPSSRAAWM